MPAFHTVAFRTRRPVKEAISVIRIYDAPLNYLMPGIDPRYTEAVCWAHRLGFQRFGDALNMKVDLDYSDWKTEEDEKALETSGILIYRPPISEFDEVLSHSDLREV